MESVNTFFKKERDTLYKWGKEDGVEQGIEKGIEKGRKETLAEKNHSVVENLITKLGLSDDQAADVAEVSIPFVRKVRKELAAKNNTIK